MSTMPESQDGSSPLIVEVRQDDLKPDVKDYATNLSSQLNVAFANSGKSDFETFLNSLENEELNKVKFLIEKLYEVRLSGEIPFDEEEYAKKYDQLIENYNDYRNNNFSPKSDEIRSFILEEVSKLPDIPIGVLEKDPSFLDRLLKRTVGKSIYYGTLGGLTVSMLFNKSLAHFDTIWERNKILQQFDLNSADVVGKFDCLGFELNGGVIDIKGAAGTHLGEGMKAGRIKAFMTTAYCGSLMSGGEIDVTHVEGMCLGIKMSGGVIKAKKAGSFVGVSSTGGMIFLESKPENISADCQAEVYVNGEKYNK